MPHGHNEIVSVSLKYNADRPLDPISNCATDFSELKRDWHGWIDNSVDHVLQLNQQDPLLDYFQMHEPEQLQRLLITPGDPSTEMLAALFICKFSAFITARKFPFHTAALTIEETPTNQVKITPQDVALFPRLSQPGWWCRADPSVNDLDRQLTQQSKQEFNVV